MQDDIIQNAWVNFAKAALPPSVPIAMRTYFRRAMFVGAQVMFIELLTKTIQGEGGEQTDPDLVASLQRELTTFFKEQLMVIAPEDTTVN